MKRYYFLVGFILLTFVSHAQQTTKEIVAELNKYIALYSADNASQLVLYETLGTLEQKINENSYQRIKLSAIGSIKVEPNANGCTVNLKCGDAIQCITFIKNDKAGVPMPSNAFFFTDAKSANSFAKRLEELIAKYPSENKAPQVELLKGQDGSVALLTKEVAKEKPKVIVKKIEEAEDNEEVEVEPKDKRISKTKKVKEETDEEVEPNSNTKEKTNRKKKQVDQEEQEPIEEEISISRKNFSQNNNEPEDVTEMVCKQLIAILEAGKKSKFKQIEGAETNPAKKINESKVKLKGAKRSYLSWYKNERAFIAEYKTSSDNELILIEFERIQTELENCLEGDWDNIDHAHDAMYDDVKAEIKDVEYKLAAGNLMPSMRIMLNIDDKGKFTLFVRIQ